MYLRYSCTLVVCSCVLTVQCSFVHCRYCVHNLLLTPTDGICIVCMCSSTIGTHKKQVLVPVRHFAVNACKLRSWTLSCIAISLRVTGS